jgi:hypothetical protein
MSPTLSQKAPVTHPSVQSLARPVVLARPTPTVTASTFHGCAAVSSPLASRWCTWTGKCPWRSLSIAWLSSRSHSRSTSWSVPPPPPFNPPSHNQLPHPHSLLPADFLATPLPSLRPGFGQQNNAEVEKPRADRQTAAGTGVQTTILSSVGAGNYLGHNRSNGMDFGSAGATGDPYGGREGETSWTCFSAVRGSLRPLHPEQSLSVHLERSPH